MNAPRPQPSESFLNRASLRRAMLAFWLAATLAPCRAGSPEIVVHQPVGNNLQDGTARVDFGPVSLGSSAPRTFFVFNAGDADLILTNPTKNGANAGNFAVSALQDTTLSAHSFTTFEVTFTPSALGVRSAAIHLSSNDSDESPFDIALTGTGANHAPAGTDKTITVQPGATLTVAEADWGFSDPEDSPANQFTYVKIGTLPTAGMLRVDDVDVSEGQTISMQAGLPGVVWTARESSRWWLSVASSADGTRLVAGPATGYLYTSANGGASWTARMTDTQRTWFAVASSADGTKLIAGAGSYLYTSTDSGASWTARMSGGQHYWFSVASSADGTRLVAADMDGLLYTSTDAGVTWTARDSSRHWFALASSADGTRLVAAVYSGQLYTSTDAGVTWTARENNRSWYSVASSADGTRLVAAVYGGQLYTSTDGGVSWTARETARDWCAVTSSADGTRLVAAVDGRQLYTSIDGGVRWTVRDTYREWCALASSADGSRLLAGVRNGQLYTSAPVPPVIRYAASPDGGIDSLTFQVGDDGVGINLDPSPNTLTFDVLVPPEISVEQPLGTDRVDGVSSIDFGSIALGSSGAALTFRVRNMGDFNLTLGAITADGRNGSDFAVNTSGMATTLVPGQTTTFSVTFTPSGSGARTAALHIVNNDSNENPFDLALAGWSPYHVPAGTDKAITVLPGATYTFALDDWGLTDPNDIPPNVLKQVELTTLPAVGHLRVEGVDATAGQFVPVQPWGATWSSHGPSGYWRSIAASSDGMKLVAAAGSPGDLCTSIDGGTNWTVRVTGGDHAWYAVASSADGSKLLAADTGRYLYTSTDSGATWTPRMTDIGRSWTSVASSADGTKLVAVAVNSAIYTSNDSGVTWTARIGGDWWEVASSSDGNTLVAAEDYGALATSADGGVSWSWRTTGAGLPIWGAVACSGDGHRLLAANRYGQLYLSIDGGATWTARGPTGSWGAAVASADGSQWVVGVYGGSLYTSTDGGTNWTAQMTDASRQWSSIASSADGTRLAAAVTGGSFYTSVGVVPRVLTYSAPEGGGTNTFTFRVEDDGMGNSLDPSPNTITLKVPSPPEIAVQCPVGIDLADGSASIDFGTEDVGTGSAIRTFTIVNTGGLDLVLSGITVDGAHPADFVVGALGATTVASGASTTFTVTFGPKALGARSATIHLASNDSDENPFDVALTGTGQNNAPAGTDKTITVLCGRTYTFTPTDWGFTDPHDSPANTFTRVRLTTLPTAGQLKVDGVDATAGQYVSVQSSGGALPLITYAAPTETGTDSFTFQVEDDGIGHNLDLSPNTLTLDLAYLPEVTVEQPAGSDLADGTASVDFGPVNVRSSTTRSFIVRNTGNFDLTLGAVSLDGVNADDFTVDTTGMSSPVAPGGSTTFTVTFATGATGARSAALHLGNSDSDEDPFDIGLAGTGQNWAPAGTDNTITVMPGATYTLAEADWGFSDPDDSPANNFTGVKITDLPAAGALQLDGADITAGQVVPVQATPAGAVWTQRMADGARSWYSVASSADGARLVAGVRGGWLYTSTDGGQTWTARMTDASRDWNSVASSADGTRLVAADFGGQLYTSTDGGASWIARTTGTIGAWWISVASSADGAKLVAACLGLALYTSTDGGLTWGARMTYPSRYWCSVASSADGTRFVAAEYGGQLYTSTDGGVIWTARMTDASREWCSVASSADGAKLVAAEAGGFLYTSTDGGQTWTARMTDAVRSWYSVASSADGTRLVGADGGNGQLWTSVESNPVVTYTAPMAGATDTVTFQVEDDGYGDTLDQTPNTITFDVPPPTEIAVECPSGTDLGDDTASVDFGSVDPFSSSEVRTFTVKNVGEADLVLGTIAVDGAHPGDFTVNTDGTSGTVVPGGSTAFTVTFTPQTTGPRSAVVHITNNDVGKNPFDIALTGVGQNYAPAGTDNSLTVGVDATYRFTVADWGFTDPDDSPANTFSRVRLTTLPTAGRLQVDGVDATAGQYVSVQPGAGETIPPITYTAPSSPGTDSFTFQVEDDGVGHNLDLSPNTMALGLAHLPEIAVEQPAGTELVDGSASVDFGSVGLGSGAAKTFVVRNTGSLDLTLGTVSLDGANAGEFSVDATGMSSPVAPGESTTFTVTFAPSATGARSAALHIGNDDNNENPFDMVLAGTGRNWAPAGTDKTITVMRGATYTFGEADWGFTDPDDSPANAFTGFALATLPTAGVLQVEGVPATAGQFVSTQPGPAGATWTARMTDAQRSWASVASSADGTKLVAAAYVGSLYTSTDGGLTWTARMTDADRAWYSVASSVDGMRLVAGVFGGSLHTSTDGGLTWTARMTDADRYWPSVASSADGTRLVAAAYYGWLYTSTDSGLTWTVRMADAMRPWYCVASSADGTKLVAGVVGGSIFTSTDGGMTWGARMADTDRMWSSVASSADGTRLVAAAYGGSLYTSTDGGLTWTARLTDAGRYWYSVASSADGTRLAAAVEGGSLWTSVDGGLTWTAQMTDAGRDWRSVASSADGTRLVGGVNQGSLYTSVGQPPVITYTAPVAPGAYPFTFQVEDDGVGDHLDPTPNTITINVPPPDYLVTTADHAIVVTDQTGHGDTLTVSEPGPGHIQFAAAGRSFSVDGGIYRDGDSGSIALAEVTSITIEAGGGDDTVTVQGFSDALPDLTIDGGTGADRVSLHAGTTATVSDPDGVALEGGAVSTLLTVDSDAAVLQTAALTGSGGLRKSGAGTLTLGFGNSYSGDTVITAGTLALALDSSHNNVASSPNLIIAAGATLDVRGLADGRLDLADHQLLQGEGTVLGTLGVSSGATLAPGSSPGILKVDSVLFSPGATFEVEIEGPTAGTQYDQLQVTGPVDLGGATLSVLGSYAPGDDTFVIIDNRGSGAVSGTFDGLSEGAPIRFNGVDLTLSYAGGDGNDVTLEGPAPTAARLAFFLAVSGEVGPVRLSWGTLVEVGTLGFHVDRSTPRGGWERVTTALITATGRDQRPQTYALTDDANPASASLAYRLVEIDLHGQPSVLAVAAVRSAPRASLAVTGDGLHLRLRGTPNARVTIQTAPTVLGPWTVVQTCALDDTGDRTAKLEWDASLPVSFYRVSME